METSVRKIRRLLERGPRQSFSSNLEPYFRQYPDMGKHVFVVGAGVIGLSTAIRALEAGYRVTIFAKLFPGDPKSIEYTSPWAGANHVSVAATNTLQHEMERETLQVFLDLIKEDPLVPAMKGSLIEYRQVVCRSFWMNRFEPLFQLGPDEQKQIDHLSRCYSDLRIIESQKLPQGVVHGVAYTTLFFDVPRYLPYLMDRFLAAGGHAFRVDLPSLSSLLSEKERPQLVPFAPSSADSAPPFDPAAVINCTGIGALSLGDVEDKDVYPTRGEVLIIRAPWVDHGPGMSYFYPSHHSYIIPRQSGHFILGGTFQVDDWHPTSRPATVKEIKERGIEAYPELLPADKRDKRDINDLEVIEECVGLRPTRKGGIRLETTTLNVDGNTVPIIHNYGHGGAGYQASWGSARRAVDLLKSMVK
ncbi:D-aspartate oxidase [Mycena rebaudengoi]|nr:D-aspartate oxidase [Mycena rebaudengoi]